MPTSINTHLRLKFPPTQHGFLSIICIHQTKSESKICIFFYQILSLYISLFYEFENEFLSINQNLKISLPIIPIIMNLDVDL